MKPPNSNTIKKNKEDCAEASMSFQQWKPRWSRPEGDDWWETAEKIKQCVTKWQQEIPQRAMRRETPV